MTQDFYKTLGVSRNASQADIKKAYRNLAKKHHPDVNAGDEKAAQKFKEISQAYECLNNKDKRQTYDRFGHTAYQESAGHSGFQKGAQGFGAQGFGSQDFSSHFGGFGKSFGGGFSFGDIFDEFFGGNTRARQGEQAGEDLRYDIAIDLEEAFVGCTKNIQLTHFVQCKPCGGSGSKNAKPPTLCTNCQGRGVIYKNQGFMQFQQTCQECYGEGKIIQNPCPQCQGQGRVQKTNHLDVKIPKGIRDGNRIRLGQYGNVGPRGGSQGDLYIFVSIKPHKDFVRQEDDLQLTHHIPFTLAVLGGKTKIDLLGGKTGALVIPKGTQSGRQFLLRNEGMPLLNKSKKGNLYVKIMIDTPTQLTKKEAELIKQFGSSYDKKKTSPLF